MTNAAFAELETQVEELPLFQIIVLRQKLDNILEERKAERNISVGLAMLDEIAGSVNRDIDFKKEREELKGYAIRFIQKVKIRVG